MTNTHSTIKSALSRAYTMLKASSPSPRVDAEVLLIHVLQCTKAHLFTHPERPLTDEESEAYEALIHARMLGHPIAHLIQFKEFWSLPLSITPDTLIPRPETELLVELTLTLLKPCDDVHLLELGTGSGAIAIALASERPDWQIDACDISKAALSVAQQNATRLAFTNIRFSESNWFESLPAMRYHAIIANPPYIAEADPHLKEGDVRFEPITALTSGIDGLNDLTIIIQSSPNYLRAGGFLLVEHGCDQGPGVRAIFNAFGYKNIQTFQDLAGHDRVTAGFT